MLEIETDAHNSLLPGQVFTHRAKEAQLEHDGSLDVADELPLVSTRIECKEVSGSCLPIVCAA